MRSRLAILAVAVAAAILPLPSGLVEHAYSRGVYPVLQSLLTGLSNRSSLPLLDVFILSGAALWLGLLAADIVRRPALRALGAVATRTVVWGAVCYLAFLGCWGLNYRREALTTRLRYDAQAVTPQALDALAATAGARVNALYATAHAAGWPSAGDARVDPALAAAFARAARATGGGDVRPARPKATHLDWYFRRAAVDGMTDPFFLETLVAEGPLPLERPFVIAHEWSHLAGLADEGEANFLGWLTCVYGPPPAQYSGWLFLTEQLQAALPRRARAPFLATLQAGPRADLAAIRARVARTYSPRVASAGWRVYDRYLKANRVESGAASYSDVLRLILGVSFGPDWTPLPRPAAPPASSS